LQRKTSSVVGPKAKLKNCPRKTGHILKHTGQSMTLFESFGDADGSPRMPATIQFATSNVSHEGARDSDVTHGEYAADIAGKRD
jgi:hypothetical protein